MRLPLFIAISILSTPIFALEAEDSCDGATTWGQLNMCIQGNLDKLNEEMTAAYKAALAKSPNVEEQQNQWTKSLELCADDDENEVLCASLH